MQKCECGLDVEKCILHCEKDDWNDEDKLIEFWEAIRNNIFPSLTNIKNTHTFKNIIFPKYEAEKKVYDDIDLNFTPYTDSNFNPIFELSYFLSAFSLGEISLIFENCIFLEGLDLSIYNFQKDIKFENCIFKKELVLNEYYKSDVSFEKCDFSNNSINLSNKYFASSLKIRKCQNISYLDCTMMKCSMFNLRDSVIQSANFYNAIFYSPTIFMNTTFENNIDFKYAQFEKKVFFTDAIFEKKLNLREAIFKEDVNFLDMKVGSVNRETARIIKHSFEDQGNIIESNRFYALEMEEMDKELTKSFCKKPLKNENLIDYLLKKSLSELIIFKFHSLSSEHSQNWFLALVWIFIIGIIAYFIGGEDLNNKSIQVNNDIFIGSFVFLLLSTLTVIFNKFDKLSRWIIGIFLSYLLYNFLVIDNTSFSALFQQISPFSKLGKDMTAIDFIAKVIITYLIYQFVVSIRQNTRRS